MGWGLLNQFSPFRYFPIFSEWLKHWLPVWHYIHIWQVSPQLSCGDTWQIWMWLKVSNLYFCQIEISCYGEINEQSFSNPHPWSCCQDQRALPQLPKWFLSDSSIHKSFFFVSKCSSLLFAIDFATWHEEWGSFHLPSSCISKTSLTSWLKKPT